MDRWEDSWRLLLEGRFVVEGDDLVESPQAQIFLLGYTVAEVSEAIGFTGLTNRETEWRESQTDRWQLVDGSWSEIDGWREDRTAKELAAAIESKSAEITTESKRLQSLDITYDGHTYAADGNGIAQTMNAAVAQGIADTESIPDAGYGAGNWPTTEVDSSENAVLMAITVADLKGLFAAIYNRAAALNKLSMQKIATISDMSDVEDVVDYDALSGWE